MTDKIAADKKYSFVFASDESFDQRFDELLAECPEATAFYTRLVWLYTHEYLTQKNMIEDASFFLLDEDKTPLAFCPLYIIEEDQGPEFSSIGVNCNYLRAPLLSSELSGAGKDSAAQGMWEEVQGLAARKNVRRYVVATEPELESRDPFWNVLLEKTGHYQNNDTFVQLIDLNKGEVQLKSDLRSSYKPLINKATRTFKTVIIDSKNWSYELCEKYRNLHLQAVGFATRSTKTFEMMYEMIQRDQAYLVGIANDTGDWLGAFLFYRLNGKVFYASSALAPSVSNREGVGHLGLWQGILYAKERKDSFLNLGWQPEDSDANVDDKVKNIAFFKRGFGGVRARWFRGVKKL